MKRLERTLTQLLLLFCMLAYVIIPHQGDFLDSLTLNPLLSTSAGVVEIQQQLLSPFQAVLQGQAIPVRHDSHAHVLAETQLSHPENFLLPERFAGNSLSAALLCQMPAVMVPVLQKFTLVFTPRTPPPPLPSHRASTVLLI